MSYTIDLLWDDDASVWVASSKDIPGLVLESGSFDALVERIRYAVPELMRLNGKALPPYGLKIHAERTEPISVYG